MNQLLSFRRGILWCFKSVLSCCHFNVRVWTAQNQNLKNRREGRRSGEWRDPRKELIKEEKTEKVTEGK